MDRDRSSRRARDDDDDRRSRQDAADDRHLKRDGEDHRDRDDRHHRRDGGDDDRHHRDRDDRYHMHDGAADDDDRRRGRRSASQSASPPPSAKRDRSSSWPRDPSSRKRKGHEGVDCGGGEEADRDGGKRARASVDPPPPKEETPRRECRRFEDVDANGKEADMRGKGDKDVSSHEQTKGGIAANGNSQSGAVPNVGSQQPLNATPVIVVPSSSKSPYRSSTMENQNRGSLSEQLDIGSQAMNKNDTSDLRAVGKEIADEVDNREEYHSPEYSPGSEVENPWLVPDSPSTKQRKIEKMRRKHMATASNALGYYHTNHPGDHYTPVHVNLKHVIYLVDIKGYYIHMNFTARNTKDGSEKIFFAELRLNYEGPHEWVVTACDIVGPGARGGLRGVWCTEISFVGDTIDVQNCYACDDFIKHIDGAMYEAGHGGPLVYECNDISVE